MAARTVSPAGIRIIQNAESWAARRYICPAGKPTIGWGHVVKPHEKFDEPITEEHGLSILFNDLAPVEIYLTAILPEIPQHQFDALASLAFNIGLGAFEKSTLLKKLRAGDVAGAANEFQRWKFANGKELRGLVKRRAAERLLFLGQAR